MSKYMLTVMQSDANHAGSKAVKDIDKILKKLGFLSVYIDGQQSRIERELFTKSNLLRKISKCSYEDIFLIQYPFYLGRRVNNQVIDVITKKINNSIILIHDLPTLRTRATSKEISTEICNLNKFKFVIAHNESMKRWLKENGCKSKILLLNIFDYLVDNIEEKKRVGSYKRIFFAGNLGKSQFIYNNLIDETYNIYGINKKEVKSNFNYLGIRTPEKLVEELSNENGFGLVWDGSSVSESDYYTRYNNPHKTSLYLVSGLPVIVWSKSALSEFVKSKKIGIVANDINDVNKKIQNLTLEEYDEYLKNVSEIRIKLAKGKFTEKAISSAINL